MKKMKTTILAAAVACGAMAYSAHASLTPVAGFSNTTVYHNGGNDLSIDYSVDYDDVNNDYVYNYTLTTTPGRALTSFTLSTFTPTLTITGFGNSNTTGIGLNSVYWGWAYNAQVIPVVQTTTDTVQFTSDYAPSWFAFTVNDDVVTWQSPAKIPGAAAPVPEASTFVAGALMLLPLGMGAVRALRKDRTV